MIYLTTFSAFGIYQLIPSVLAFAIFVILGVLCATLAVINNARILAFLAIIGASGSGKSSVAHAGLIPALLGGQSMENHPAWAVHVITPTEQPLRALASSLADPNDPNSSFDRPIEPPVITKATLIDAPACGQS